MIAKDHQVEQDTITLRFNCILGYNRQLVCVIDYTGLFVGLFFAQLDTIVPVHALTHFEHRSTSDDAGNNVNTRYATSGNDVQRSVLIVAHHRNG